MILPIWLALLERCHLSCQFLFPCCLVPGPPHDPAHSAETIRTLIFHYWGSVRLHCFHPVPLTTKPPHHHVGFNELFISLAKPAGKMLALIMPPMEMSISAF